jgi:lysozyme
MDMLLMAQELRRDEGEKLTSYLDTEDYWTIGVGHLIDPKRGAGPAPFGTDLRNGGVITPDQSRQLLELDIAAKMEELDARLPWWRRLSEVRQRAILNMAFNLGVAGLLMFKNTLAAVQRGDWPAAARGMLASKWATQVGRRADRLAYMMEHDRVPP